MLGAVLLVVAEFAPLLDVRSTQRDAGIVASVQTGSHHSFALIPVALAAAALALGGRRSGSWPAPVALIFIGLIALAIALVGDLPDARATGLVTVGGGSYASAQASPAIGFFLETLGAVLLVAGGGAALLLRAPAGRSHS